jgi:hypothetical protein
LKIESGTHLRNKIPMARIRLLHAYSAGCQAGAASVYRIFEQAVVATVFYDL